jgi:hypothetical protein
MSTEALEVEALKLASQDRARLAEKLLQSRESLSDEENAMLWAVERKAAIRLGMQTQQWVDPLLMSSATRGRA